MQDTYKIHGYLVDYYVRKKYMGDIYLETPDRENFGYQGRQYTTLEQDIVLRNGRKIKKGTEIVTECIPICGRRIQKQVTHEQLGVLGTNMRSFYNIGIKR